MINSFRFAHAGGPVGLIGRTLKGAVAFSLWRFALKPPKSRPSPSGVRVCLSTATYILVRRYPGCPPLCNGRFETRKVCLQIERLRIERSMHVCNDIGNLIFCSTIQCRSIIAFARRPIRLPPNTRSPRCLWTSLRSWVHPRRARGNTSTSSRIEYVPFMAPSPHLSMLKPSH